MIFDEKSCYGTFVKSRNAFTFICIGQCILSPTAIYSPLEVSGRLCPSIHVIGREGVWRLLNSEYFASSAEVRMKMKDEVSFLQPEHEKFMLDVLSAGSFPFLLQQYVI